MRGVKSAKEDSPLHHLVGMDDIGEMILREHQKNASKSYAVTRVGGETRN